MLKRIAAAPAVMVLAASVAVQLPLALASAAAWAGQPENWRIGFQEPATEGARSLQDFHDLLTIIIVAITLFVTVLLGYVMWRYRASRNPEPAQFSHNTVIEVLWTIIPVIILVVIAIPSFNLLYFLDRTAEPELTINVTAQQFSWVYEYPDNGGMTIYSTMKQQDALEEGEPYLLAVDNPMVVPIDTNVQLLITSQDVLHSFGVPSFALKTDAVTGRTNETWFKAVRTGVFYGQCSEICGANHAYMPIEIRVVEQDEFEQWVASQQADQGVVPDSDTSLAALD
ncbi:MAG: cytochrome c oxidase subunit II [Alphaproteobacteria bacterium]